MTYGGASFDTVVLYNAIGHLADIAELVLSECLRVIRSRGCIYITSFFVWMKFRSRNNRSEAPSSVYEI